MSSMDDKIREALNKSLKEGFVFRGLNFYESKTLGEFFSENLREDYIWEESLAESLYKVEDDEKVGDRAKEFKVGDIILTNRFMSNGSYVENSPHKILIVTSKKEEEGTITYSGFLLSSKKEKSNKYNDFYPHNIYISPYNSILYKGARSNQDEVFIRVDDLVTFTNMDLSVSGSWKGKASWEFLTFVQKCVDNYRSGKSNATMHWIKE